MSNITEDLKHRISTLPDEDLLKMVSAERDNYREETINFAEEQLQARQVPFEKPAERTESSNSEKTLFSIYAENNSKGSSLRDWVGVLYIVGWSVLFLFALMSPIDTQDKIVRIAVQSILSVLFYNLHSRRKHK
jgi:hypothetical protein